jgi:putative hydroxymethylpyrimidine transport system permease protein
MKLILKRGTLLKKAIAIIFAVIFISIIWEFAVNYFEIPKRILPAPSQIIEYLYLDIISGKFTILNKSLITTRDALIGFSISMILGSLLGILFSQKKSVSNMFMPFTLISQLLPVPAFAPIVAAWLGYGIETKILIIVIFTIFPVIKSVESAINSISRDYLALFKTYNASKNFIITKLVLPHIIPDFFTILKILVTASIVTSIIAELPLTVSGGIGKRYL